MSVHGQKCQICFVLHIAGKNKQNMPLWGGITKNIRRTKLMDRMWVNRAGVLILVKGLYTTKHHVH